MRSITACWLCSSLVAAALSPVAIALRTFLTAVRRADFKLALWRRVASACRARLRAWAVLAMCETFFAGAGEKKTGHNSHFSRFAQGESARLFVSDTPTTAPAFPLVRP